MRVRFSLRLFLVVFTIVAVLFGAGARFVGSVKDQVRRQKLARQALAKMGFVVDSSSPMPQIQKPTPYVEFLRKWVEPDAYQPIGEVSCFERAGRTSPDSLIALRHLRDVYGLSWLTVADLKFDAEICRLLSRHPNLTLSVQTCSVDPTIAAQFRQLTNLRELTIHHSIEDDVARAISQLPRLETLAIDTSRLSERGLKSLSQSGPLKRLELANIMNSPAPVAALVAGKPLQELELFVNAGSDGALYELSKAQDLRKLVVHCVGSSPENLFEAVSKLKSLRHLRISGSQLKNTALREIVNCRQLDSCDLGSIRLTSEEFASLQGLSRIKSLAFVGDPVEAEIQQFFLVHPDCVLTIRPPNHNDFLCNAREFQMQKGQLLVRELMPMVFGGT